MATTTQQSRVAERSTRARGRVSQSRAYDHIYDTTYQVSGATVHNRHVNAAIAGRTVHVPDAQNMFSELVHHPRGYTQVRPDDPVPATVARDFGTRNLDATARSHADYARCDLTGTDRHKFAGRPQLPGLQREIPNVVLSSINSRLDPVVAQRLAARQVPAAASTTGTSRTVGTQSDYRESEAQTDPWTPAYHVRPGSAPEVLTLQSLAYGHGLPAGLNEVIMIERARAKLAWEKTLPDITDEKNAELRIKMMEEQDAREWKWREEEIEAIQEERLALVEKIVAERAQAEENGTTARLEQVLAKRRAEWERSQKLGQARNLRDLRKLQRARAQVEPIRPDNSAVAQYTSPSSAVYAGVTRDGSHDRDDHEGRFRVDSRYTSTYTGLLELEASLPLEMTNPRIERPPKRTRPRGGRAHSEDRYQTKLESILLNLKLPKSKPSRPLKYQQRIPTPPKRGEVGEVDVLSAEVDAHEQAAILLQRILRGRAEQAAMYEGKEQRRELIDELKATHALQAAAQKEKANERDRILAQHAAVAAERNTKAAAESVLYEVAGRHAGQMLDYLSKELIRLQEERRIHAFAKLAERQRRMREAAEAGLRQKEETRRQQNDEIFRQIVGVHQDCVDTFLEDVLGNAQSAAADEVARQEIQEKASEIDRVAQALFDSGMDKTNDTAMSISAELVSQFLLPEADRLAVRQRVKQKQKVLQVAAHRELLSGAATVDEALTVQSGKTAEESLATDTIGAGGETLPPVLAAEKSAIDTEVQTTNDDKPIVDGNVDGAQRVHNVDETSTKPNAGQEDLTADGASDRENLQMDAGQSNAEVVAAVEMESLNTQESGGDEAIIPDNGTSVVGVTVDDEAVALPAPDSSETPTDSS